MLIQCHRELASFVLSVPPFCAVEAAYPHSFCYNQHLQYEVPVVTGIHLHALFVCLKHCLSEEAATKELCLFPQTVLVTFCLFEQ